MIEQRKQPKAKKVKARVTNPEIIREILDANTAVMVLSTGVVKQSDQPSVAELRKILSPAYAAMKQALYSCVNLDVTEDALYGLSIQSNTSVGSIIVSVSVSAGKEHLHEDRSFNFHFLPSDGLNFALRAHSKPVRLAGTSKLDSLNDYLKV